MTQTVSQCFTFSPVVSALIARLGEEPDNAVLKLVIADALDEECLCGDAMRFAARRGCQPENDRPSIAGEANRRWYVKLYESDDWLYRHWVPSSWGRVDFEGTVAECWAWFIAQFEQFGEFGEA